MENNTEYRIPMDVLSPYKRGEELGKSGEEHLRIIKQNWDVLNPERYNTFLRVIAEANRYDDPLHILAVAVACHHSRVYFRMMAVRYFELYLANYVPCKSLKLTEIYRWLAEDYEGLYEFEKAEKYYLLALQVENLNDLPYPTPCENILGRLYYKFSTQRVLDYWEEFKKRPQYQEGSEYKRHVDLSYDKAVARHKRHYVYKAKPRDIEYVTKLPVNLPLKHWVPPVTEETIAEPVSVPEPAVVDEILPELPKKRRSALKLGIALFCAVCLFVILITSLAEPIHNAHIACIIFAIPAIIFFALYARDKYIQRR